MSPAPAALPETVPDLRQVGEQLLAERSAKQQLIDKLTHQLALFRRYLYGRRSEQLDPGQLMLEFASWVQALNAAVPAEAPAAPSPPPQRRGHGRKPLPGLLPRRRVEYALPEAACTCQACGARLVKIGEEMSEQL